MTVDTTPTPEPPAAPPPVFGWLPFIGGILLALGVGGIANVFAALLGMASGVKPLAFVSAAIPGLIFVVLSVPARKNGFGQGLLVGGCVIGLLGGICGAMMVGSS
jgi:hypothetical protein